MNEIWIKLIGLAGAFVGAMLMLAVSTFVIVKTAEFAGVRAVMVVQER
jgi:hypothetical protein